MSRRVVLLGLDGVSPDLIGPWIEEGELPTFRRFVEEGCFGHLESTIPTMTPPGWVSLTSGKNPGQHGIYGFGDPRGGGRKIVNSEDVKDKRIWDVLDDHGLSSCVVNVPVTYPPDRVNGIMVSDFLTPSGAHFTYPRELQKELEDYGYVIDVTVDRGGFAKAVVQFFDETDSGSGPLPDEHPLLDPSSPQSLYVLEKQILGKHMEVLHMLAGKRRWDFIMYVTRGTDAIQHFYWNSPDIVLDFMKVVDGHLATLIERLGRDGETGFIVVSDHGFAKAPIYNFNAGDWIYSTFSAARARGVAIYLHLKAAKAVNRWKSVKPVQMLFVTLRNRLEKYLPVKAVPWIGLVTGDPQAIGQLDQIPRQLTSLSTPEGRPVFALVEPREKVYSGRNLQRAPDVVWVPSAEVLPTNHFEGRILTPSPYPTAGAHWGSRKGLIMAMGSGITQGSPVEASMLDVAPTVYALLSVPVPSDLDGVPMKDVISPRLLSELKLERGPPAVKEAKGKGLSEEDESEILERLKALGYVD